MVKIKKGTITLSVNRSDLIQAEPTHDGVVFNLKEGIHIYCADAYMPAEAKQKISVAPDNFLKGEIEINLKDYKNPVKVNLG